jgi:hypothetical protein
MPESVPSERAAKHRIYDHWFDTGNAKARKGLARSYLTAIHYMAPATSAGGPTVCPWAARCTKPCLAWGGRGHTPNVREGRMRRSRLFHENPRAYGERHLLAMFGTSRIGTGLAQVAKRSGMTPALRLNGTSDIPWEDHELGGVLADKRRTFPAYDYTKGWDRVLSWLHGKRSSLGLRSGGWGEFEDVRDYHLTLSLGGSLDVRAEAPDVYQEVLDRGGTIAAVWLEESMIPWEGVDRFVLLDDHGKPSREIALGKRRRLIDGNVDDLRFFDDPGTIVALYARKGGNRAGDTRLLDTGRTRFFLQNPSRARGVAYVTGLPMAALEPR